MKLFLLLLLLLYCTSSIAQTTLGELLDAGAKRLSAEEFRQDVAQRTLVGPSPTGGSMELVYTKGGFLTGKGSPAYSPVSVPREVQIDGEWSTDEKGRVCTVVSILGHGRGGGNLPPRCQFWFKLGESFFLSDSDLDRYAKVLPRKIKQ